LSKLDWQIFFQDTGGGQTYLQWLMQAWGWTLAVALLALVIALVVGSLIGILRTVPNRVLSIFGEAWTELFRNVPLIVQLNEISNAGNILVRTQPENTKAVLAELSKICTRLNPKFPFSSFFADEQYQKKYKTESIVGQLTDCFALLAISISCLGLLGLVMFTAEQRTREIGIRKVLGASIFSLFTLLSNEFLVLVLIALFIASPMAWWATHAWLQGYAYQVAVEWWFFGLAGAMVLLIALITVSFQALKAAMVNPVRSLRAE